VLGELPQSERERLLKAADRVRLPVRYTFARAGEAIESAYFPERGVLSILSEMTTGHQVAVAAIGAEGVVGLGSLLGMSDYRYRVVVLAESEGYRVPAAEFRRAFDRSRTVRRTLMTHVGNRMLELTIAAACHRVHPHRQRLARWLLTITDKAGQRWLRVTHETLAQMVGGPRHAVSVALKELRAVGAIVHLRERIEIADRSALIVHACECYARHPHVVPA
jgi:CRP-like cAMP-binding protein